jgi:glutamine amidotransferase
MCILVVCEPNSTPSKSDLHAGACANPHGFGFAIHAGDKIISERSMSAKKSIKRFMELREQYPNGYAMWHARYATHGVKNEQNCHPFQVGDDEGTYLAHNGVLDVAIPHGDRRSDTRVFAEDTLPKLGGVNALDDDTIWLMISKWASGSKIAILTTSTTAKYPMYLVNENLGTWDNEGIWWSNQSHKRTTYTKPAVLTTNWAEVAEVLDDSELDEPCPYCLGIVDLSDNPYYCPTCTLCFDCSDVVHNCMCYTPSTAKWTTRKDYDLFAY